MQPNEHTPDETQTFHGHRLDQIEFKGQRVRTVRDIALALEYSDGHSLTSSILKDWNGEFEEGRDYVWAEGEAAQMIARARGWPQPGRCVRLMLLTESGINLACLKTTKPKGKELRRWIASDVIPQVARTGSYQGQIPAEAAPPLPPAQEPAPAEVPLPGVGPLPKADPGFIDEDRIVRLVSATVAATMAPFLARLLPAAQPQPGALPPPAAAPASTAVHAPPPGRTAAPPPAAQAPLRLPPIPPATTRKRLTRHMRDALSASLSPLDRHYRHTMRERWRALYKALYDRCGIDIRQRSDHMRMDPLEAAEHVEVRGGGRAIELLYALAREMFPVAVRAA